MKTLIHFAALAALALAGVPAMAAPPAEEAPSAPPQRMSTLVVYGDDPCPKSTSDEIVVCAREPESERYRVPKRFRDQKKALASQGSWTANVRQLDAVSRSQNGLPDTCSPVGSGGQSGCQDKFLRDARNQRKADKQEAQDDGP